MNGDALREVIERLEKCTGPDCDLDGDIAVLMGLYARRPKVCVPPRYTESIDAALTTLPPGWEYSISTLYGLVDVELPLNDTVINPIRVRRFDGNVPLAILEASFRARQKESEHGE